MTVDYVSQRDFTAVLRLKALIGPRAAHLRVGEHPLGEAMCLVPKWLRGRVTQREMHTLGNADLAARALLDLEPGWRGMESELRQRLVKAKSCESLLFELDTHRVALRGSAGTISWQGLLPAAPDFQVQAPEFAVECKLIDEVATRSVLEVIRMAARQHEELDCPYIISVGFSGRFDRLKANELTTKFLESSEWFRSHPRVSGVLCFIPARELPNRPAPLGLTGSYFKHGTCLVVRNNRSSRPLPANYRFRTESRG